MAGDLVKRVMIKITADDGDSRAKLDAITAKADQLGREHPELKVRIDTASASAKLAVLRHELKDTASATSDAKVSSSGLGRMMQRLSDAASSVTGPLSSLGPALSLFSGGGGIAIGVTAGLASGLGGIIPAAAAPIPIMIMFLLVRGWVVTGAVVSGA